jgi:hypothetical protein
MGSGAWATGRGEVRGSDLVPADCSQSGFAQGWVATNLHGVAGLGEALATRQCQISGGGPRRRSLHPPRPGASALSPQQTARCPADSRE